MSDDIRIALLGLDTSHAIAFAGLLHDEGLSVSRRVKGMRVSMCYREDSAFRTDGEQDQAQARLEGWGIRVTRSLDEALGGCDAVMLLANDPARHLPLFREIAGTGKPVFIDKPLAASLAEGSEIVAIASAKGMRFFSASALRFLPDVARVAAIRPVPRHLEVAGPIHEPPAGSGVFWYGVHTVEMLHRVMGFSRARLHATRDQMGILAEIDYADGRHGVIRLNRNDADYGLVIIDRGVPEVVPVDITDIYLPLMRVVADFFRGGAAPVKPADSLEILTILQAIDTSLACHEKVDLA